MKRFAVALLAGIMVLGSTALGDEIVFDDGFSAENEAVEISADDELEEEFIDSEVGFFFEDVIAEEFVEEISEMEEEVLDTGLLIEDAEEAADEDTLALADDGGILKASNYGTQIETGPCGAYGNSIQWTVYDSDGDSVADTLVFDGSGIMDDYDLVWNRNEQGEYVVDEENSETTLPWVHYSKNITSIICNGTISHIGSCAFAYTAIESIDLVSFCDSNLTIGRFAFCNCINLRLTEIPSNVVSIEFAAFENCYQIKNIYLPNSIINIEENSIGFDWIISTNEVVPSAGFSISCERSSEAYKYALRNNLQVNIIENSQDPSETQGDTPVEKVVEKVVEKTVPQYITQYVPAQPQAQGIVLTPKSPSVKVSKLKKKNQTIKISKALTVANAQGIVIYRKTSGSKKITIDPFTGKITLQKGLKKGTYKIGIQVIAVGNATYASEMQNAVVKIKVK